MKSLKAIISIDMMSGDAELRQIEDIESLSVVGLYVVAAWMIKMENSIYIWLSDAGERQAPDLLLSNFVVGMPNKIAPDEGSLTTTLIRSKVVNGGRTDEFGESLASRLARRLQCQVFVSESLDRFYSMPETLFSIEKKVLQFILESSE